MGQNVFRLAGLGAVLAVCTMAGADVQARGTSSQAANELVSTMKAQNLDAIAVQDPENPDRFIAAMLVPDVQLLVVAGQSTAPAYLQAKIAEKNYREVYSTLHSAVVPDSKLFIQDMGCDGLVDREGSIDIMYEKGATQTIFDRDWKRQKMSRQDYEEKVKKADAEYSRMLALLMNGLRGTPAGTAG